MNITVLFFFDDEGCVCHLLVITRKNYKRVANMLYWNNHHVSIANNLGFQAISPKGNKSTKFAFAALDIFRLMKC